MKTEVPSLDRHVGNCDVCDKEANETYLEKDIIGMVSFQKRLVENIYVTPVWFNGAFVKRKEKQVIKDTGMI